jgi:acyl dehydratase
MLDKLRQSKCRCKTNNRVLRDGFKVAKTLDLGVIEPLASQIVSDRRRGRAFNYGFDRVRFPAPAPAGSRIRLHMQIISVERKKDGVFIRNGYTMELEGESKAALSAEMMVLAYD